MKTKQTILATTSVRRLSTILVATALACCWSGHLGWGGQSDQPEQSRTPPPEPWQAGDLLKPEELAKSLSTTNSEKPLLLFVGYSLPYQGGHIPGSKFIGQASKPEGIQALIGEVQDQPQERQIVLYCGCCPWDKCPNIRPAFRAVQGLGFKNLKVLYLPNRFQQDWTAKGFPVQKGDGAK
ncbi:MAG: rhodanese-like domain-containing protein [Verrucomicrobiia bacterium]|jgi:hypothetical protein